MADSRIEALLQNWLGADNELLPPMSNNERILMNILGMDGVEINPIQSPIETLLLQILEQGGGGGGSNIDAIIDGSITSVKSNVATIKSGVFNGFTKLETAIFPEATSVPDNCFWGCVSLTDVSIPKATSLGQRAFVSCTALTTISCPSVQRVGGLCFQSCSKLTAADFPNAITIDGSAFQQCIVLENVNFPAVKSISNSAFSGCVCLENFDFPALTSIAGEAFSGCSKLSTLILRANNVVTLASINVFNGTPFAAGKVGGKLYVPSALIAEYQSANNWSTILGYETNQILPIEGSEYE